MGGKGAGRTGARMRAIRQQIRQTETHCWRCGQRIDWAIPYRNEYGTNNPDAGTVEHKLPLSAHPELAEDFGNLAASHLRCNQAAGDRTALPGLGLRSRNW